MLFIQATINPYTASAWTIVPGSIMLLSVFTSAGATSSKRSCICLIDVIAPPYRGLHALTRNSISSALCCCQLRVISLISGELDGITDRTFYGDRIYHHTDYFNELALNSRAFMLTPVKAVKGQPESVKMRNKAADGLFSTAVSKVRQPIESLFNWLIEKTDIQRASKVRSLKGLLVHVFGRIAAAFFYLVNP